MSPRPRQGASPSVAAVARRGTSLSHRDTEAGRLTTGPYAKVPEWPHNPQKEPRNKVRPPSRPDDGEARRQPKHEKLRHRRDQQAHRTEREGAGARPPRTTTRPPERRADARPRRARRTLHDARKSCRQALGRAPQTLANCATRRKQRTRKPSRRAGSPISATHRCPERSGPCAPPTFSRFTATPRQHGRQARDPPSSLAPPSFNRKPFNCPWQQAWNHCSQAPRSY